IHFGMFGILAMLICWNLPAMRLGPRAILALFTAAISAGLIEVLQYQLPYRDGDLVDFLAGIAGALLGSVATALSQTCARQ
ncbi:MAG: VanZ family protein, partial [Acidiferrobacterales bacterium]